MPHLDPDRLMLLALREVVPDAPDTDHLQTCAHCRAELATTREVIELGRSGKQVRDLEPPPPALWDRIAAEAFGAPTTAATSATATATAVLAPDFTGTGRRSARSRRWQVAAAAAVALVVGLLGGGLVDRALRGDPGGVVASRVVAQADLTPPAGAPTGPHGTARVVDTGHGLQLTVAVQGMPDVPGYYTVWLYDGRDVMIPLGSPGPGPLNLPAAARDLDVFQIVDVSAQDLGQQQHGRSVLQGVLQR